MLASTQVAAATLTVRHGAAAGAPVRGIDDVMGVAAPQRRTVVLDVASPPERIAIVCPGASRRGAMVLGDAHDPAAARRAARRRRCRRRG